MTSANLMPVGCRADERLRAPSAGQVLARPAMADVPALAQANAALLDECTYDCQGRTLGRLRLLAKWEAYDAAFAWSGDAGSVSDAPRSFLLLGHQPELFHPGVWIKNFAVSALARDTGRSALNLIVDNDAIKAATLRVPGGSAQEPTVEYVPFDRWIGTRPYEESHVADTALFESFADRVAAVLEPLGIKPLLGDLWPEVVQHARRGAPVGECFARARSRLERDWGFGTLELPISRMAALESFRWFTSHLLAHLPRFRDVHNTQLAQYRRHHRIRGPGRPVPELVQEGPWNEAPFWVWRTGEARRHRLFASQQAKHVVLRAAGEELARLSLLPDAEACCAVNELAQLEARGVKLRPRALTTTLFARLVLGDAFFHGIGGAKYDELTDQIIRRFFLFDPPGFVAMTATLHLPVGSTFADASDRIPPLLHRLRDLRWNPDRYVLDDSDPDVSRAIAEKHAACAHAATSAGDRRDRFDRIRRANRDLQPAVQALRDVALGSLAEARAHRQAHKVLASREYSFCLFPGQTLRAFYQRSAVDLACPET